MKYFLGETIEVFGIPVNENDLKQKLDEYKDILLKLERIPTIINLKKNIKGLKILSQHSTSHVILVKNFCKDAVLVKIQKDFDFYSAHDILSVYFSNPPSSFETVGNVIHLNLKEEFLPYKYLIGRILYEKTSLRVINKVGKINNTYRNFDFEVIGDNWLDLNKLNELSKSKESFIEEDSKAFTIKYKPGDFKPVEINFLNQETLSKKILKSYENILVDEISLDKLETVHFENGFKFVVDIKNCYWCSKLQEERRLLLQKLNKGEVFCDVFCGVGPMALPALKKGCFVICNDLNPEAVRCLRESVARNKLDHSRIKIYNLDAIEFLDQVRDLKIDHFFFNLPEHSLEYLKYLKAITYPFEVHCYFFCNDNCNVLKYIFEITGEQFKEDQVSFVRKVSPSKNMYKLNYSKN